MRRIAYIAATAFALTLFTGAAPRTAQANDVRVGISVDWFGGYGRPHYRHHNYYKPRPYYRPYRPYVVHKHHYYRPHYRHYTKRKHWYKKHHHRGHRHRGRHRDRD